MEDTFLTLTFFDTFRLMKTKIFLHCFQPFIIFQLMKLLYLSSIPIALGAVLMGWDLHHREASAFESAVFNALNQNFFALAICVFIVGYFYRCNSEYIHSLLIFFGPNQSQKSGRGTESVHRTVLRLRGYPVLMRSRLL